MLLSNSGDTEALLSSSALWKDYLTWGLAHGMYSVGACLTILLILYPRPMEPPWVKQGHINIYWLLTFLA